MFPLQRKAILINISIAFDITPYPLGDAGSAKMALTSRSLPSS
jgi:hypothetical protein